MIQRGREEGERKIEGKSSDIKETWCLPQGNKVSNDPIIWISDASPVVGFDLGSITEPEELKAKRLIYIRCHCQEESRAFTGDLFAHNQCLIHWPVVRLKCQWWHLLRTKCSSLKAVVKKLQKSAACWNAVKTLKYKLELLFFLYYLIYYFSWTAVDILNIKLNLNIVYFKCIIHLSRLLWCRKIFHQNHTVHLWRNI